MKKERILCIVALVILWVCFPINLTLTIINYSLIQLLYTICLFIYIVGTHLTLRDFRQLDNQTKKLLTIFNDEIEKATHENLREFTKWLTKRSNNYVYESLLAEFEKERGDKITRD